MIARLLGAIQFLTTAPIRARTASPGASAVFFPLVGCAIGAIGGVLLLALRQAVPPGIAALVVLAFWAMLTGGLHEDGFADVADAFRAGRPPERIHAILKDSRIGAHGALALILITLLRWQALTALAAPPVLVLAATIATSRAAIVALAWVAPPAGSGLGLEFSRDLTSACVLAALAQAGLVLFFAPAGLLLAWGACLIVAAATPYFRRRIGGITGDCLGSTALLVETWGFTLYSCQRCM